jgi:hypothetical protein
MQKIGVVAATALATGAEAYRTNHMSSSPFEGEHASKDIIEGENRSTHRAMPVASNNKYESLISKINKKAYTTPATRLYESIFGEAE